MRAIQLFALSLLVMAARADTFPYFYDCAINCNFLFSDDTNVQKTPPAVVPDEVSDCSYCGSPGVIAYNLNGDLAIGSARNLRDCCENAQVAILIQNAVATIFPFGDGEGYSLVDMNSSGEVIGNHDGFGNDKAFFWLNGRASTEELPDGVLLPDEFVVNIFNWGLNNSGQIGVTVVTMHTPDNNGRIIMGTLSPFEVSDPDTFRAASTDPVPEPSTLLLLATAAGIGLLAMPDTILRF
jgi:hypothetical protein